MDARWMRNRMTISVVSMRRRRRVLASSGGDRQRQVSRREDAFLCGILRRVRVVFLRRSRRRTRVHGGGRGRGRGGVSRAIRAHVDGVRTRRRGRDWAAARKKTSKLPFAVRALWDFERAHGRPATEGDVEAVAAALRETATRAGKTPASFPRTSCARSRPRRRGCRPSTPSWAVF